MHSNAIHGFVDTRPPRWMRVLAVLALPLVLLKLALDWAWRRIVRAAVTGWRNGTWQDIGFVLVGVVLGLAELALLAHILPPYFWAME